MPPLFSHSRVETGVVQGWPCDGPVTSPFGARDIEAHAEGHSGVDIGAAEGAPVHAPAPGLVRDVFIDAWRGTPWDAFKDWYWPTSRHGWRRLTALGRGAEWLRQSNDQLGQRSRC